MRINKIGTDNNGFTFISATFLLYPEQKTGIDYFCYYKDGILRIFTGMEWIQYSIPTWRETLNFIRKAGNWWEYRKREGYRRLKMA